MADVTMSNAEATIIDGAQKGEVRTALFLFLRCCELWRPWRAVDAIEEMEKLYRDGCFLSDTR